MHQKRKFSCARFSKCKMKLCAVCWVLGLRPIDTMHLLVDIPLLRNRHDTLKRAFIAYVRGSRLTTQSSAHSNLISKNGIRRTHVFRTLPASYYTKITFIDSGIFAQLSGTNSWRCWWHWDQRVATIRRCARGAFSLSINLFTHLSHCPPGIVSRIHKWVLGHLNCSCVRAGVS